MKFAKCVLFFVSLSIALISYAREPVMNRPDPETLKKMSVKVCETGYYNRDTWKCFEREFVEVRDGHLVFTTLRDGADRKTELLLTLDQSSVRIGSTVYAPHSYILQFPLSIGKEWSGTFTQSRKDGNVRERTRTAKVVAYRDLVLKGGTYKAYEIQSYNHLSTARNPAVERYFYCPELQTICSYESKEFDLYQEIVAVTKK